MLTSPTEDARFHSSDGFAPARHPASTQVIGNATATYPNATHGTKRPSCRAELELSWGTQNYVRCVSNDDNPPESNRRVKRRKCGMAESSFVEGKRISPCSGQIQHQQQAIARPQVKAGWYTGEVDALGQRHGKGTTKHYDGTEYEGAYFDDLMDGPCGRYKFLITQHMVSNPRQSGSHLHRQIEKSFVGSFKDDMPHGAGMVITKTMDCAPQVLGSMPVDVHFMEVIYDAGMYTGKVVGEGVRIIYTTTNFGGSSTLEMTCFRLMNGENTHLKVAPSYASWMLQCMDVEFPSPSSCM